MHLLNQKSNRNKNRHDNFRTICKTFVLALFGLLLLTAANMNVRGQVVDAFNPFASSSVYALAVQSDGKVLLGGGFTSVSGQPRVFAARVNPDGTLDTSFNLNITFNPMFGGRVDALAIQPDGKILVGGTFTSVGGVAFRSGIARINSDGTIDTTFNSNINFDPNNGGSVYSLAIQPDGKIVIGGTFVLNQLNRHIVLRLNSNGIIDSAFNPFNYPQTNFAYSVRALAIQPDGKIMIGGSFRSIPTAEQYNNLARLNSDGTLETIFSTNSQVNTLAVQPDGKILVGGNFSNFEARSYFARLNSNGTIDTDFNPNVNFGVFSTAIQSNGKILIGGGFTSVGGQPRSNLARVNSNGTLDTTFNLGTNSLVYSLATQPDGKILVGGNYSTIGGISRPNIARLSEGFRISGRVHKSGDFNTVYPGITVSLTGTTSGTKVTDAFGEYSFDNLPPNGEYSITPVTSNYTYFPSNYTFLNLLSNSNANFAATYNCSISSTSATIGANGGNGTVSVTANGGCQWTATSNVAWITITSGGSGSGNGTISYAIAPNTATTPRAGTVTIAGLVFTVNQAAFRRPAFDFDGDGRSDVSVFRPSNSVWYFLNSQSGFSAAQFGVSGDRLAPADYDGDGKTDIAVWRDEPNAPDRTNFYIYSSGNNTVRVEQFGRTGDVPVSGDWDGDGTADLAVYRDGANTANGQSLFFYRPSGTTGVDFRAIAWGVAGDKPVVGDFDADGKQDAAVFRSSNNIWYILNSLNNQPRYENWGLSSDRLVPADYNGDGATDVAVYRNGIWYIRQNNTVRYEYFGLANDIPTPADYDGDGRADIAVFRNGDWYLQRSQQGFTAFQFGLANDKPVPSAFVP